MKSETHDLLNRQFDRCPFTKAEELPTDTEIDQAQITLGCQFHKDYIEFLQVYGGGIVGSLDIYGLRPAEMMGDNWWSVVDLTIHFRQNDYPHTDEWYIISGDGFGNPIGVSNDGKVLCYDFDSGRLYEEAPDFEAFLLKQLSK